MGKGSIGFSRCSHPLRRACPLTHFLGACVSPAYVPSCPIILALILLALPGVGRGRAVGTVRGQPGAASSLPAPWPGACPCSALRAGENSIYSMDRSMEEASQGLVSRYHPGEPWPWLFPPCSASSCASHVPASMARSPPGFREARGFPSALGPSKQTFPWDLKQAQPWGKCSFAGNCSTRRRNPSPGNSHQERQRASQAVIGLEMEASALCTLGAVGSMVHPPAARRARWAPECIYPPAPCRRAGREVPAYTRAYTVLLKRCCFSCRGWMLSRSGLEI